MNTTKTKHFEKVDLSTNVTIALYGNGLNQAVVYALLPEEDNTVSASIPLARTNITKAKKLMQAFRDLETE